ncbi:MAG: hypothetical protein KAH00_02895 [Cocleimonas sp.]|nr:hypothetical protein [Cocleimonas sp.]
MRVSSHRLSENSVEINSDKCKAFKKKLNGIQEKRNIVQCIPDLVIKSNFPVLNKNTVWRRFYRRNRMGYVRKVEYQGLSIPEKKIQKDIIISICNQIKELDAEMDRHKQYSNILKARLSTLTDEKTCRSIDNSIEKPIDLKKWTNDLKKILNEINSYKGRLEALYQDVIKKVDSELDPCHSLDQTKDSTGQSEFAMRCPKGSFWQNLICIWKHR